MYRFLRASAVLAFVVFGLSWVNAGAVSPQHFRHPPICTKRFTVRMGQRAGRAVWRGTRTPTRANLRLLGYIERCQRNPAAQWFVRWYDRHQAALNAQRRYDAQFAGFDVTGRTSTFGPPSDGSGTTADGGTDDRACIALRSSSTLGRMFLVTIYGHIAHLIQCDWGPAAWTGVDIDVTGAGDEALGLPPGNYYGTARMLK